MTAGLEYGRKPGGAAGRAGAPRSAISGNPALRAMDSGFTPGRRRPGVVLLLALWLMAILSMMVLSFLRNERIEVRVAAGYADRMRAMEMCKSGIARATAILAADETAYDTAQDAWKSSESDFREHVLGDDGYFSLIYNNLDDQAEIAYGLADENGKINLNSAPPEVLKELPGMSEEIAAAIVDWRDEDDATQNGAESDYYQGLEPPYACKNAPFDTVEELMFVKGMTSAILYGEDANRNGVLDANENDGNVTYPDDDSDGVLDGGLLDFVTVYSYEQNVSQDGKPRVNINAEDEGKMASDFGEVLGPVIGSGRASSVAAEVLNYRRLMKRANSNFRFVSAANLLSPVTTLAPEEFRKAADYVTVTDDQRIEGMVNVNTARREVLAAITRTLQGFADGDVDKIVEFRSKEDSDLSGIAWVLDALEGDALKFQLLAPFITVRSGQFMAQSVGVIAPSRVVCRAIAVLDRVQKPPVVIYWKDASGLGAPFKARSIEEIQAEASTESK